VSSLTSYNNGSSTDPWEPAKEKIILNRTCTYDSKHHKYKFTGKLTTTMANLIITKADIQKKPKTMNDPIEDIL
jgi:hypothetical protein